MENPTSIFLYYPLLIIYSVLLWIAKWFAPVKKFTLKGAKYMELLNLEKIEWDLEKIKADEIILFEGSCQDGISLYIETIIHKDYSTTTLFLSEKERYFSGQFSAPFSGSTSILSCGPLLIEMRSPFRRWRITFKGYLKNSLTNQEEFITFGGWWKPITDARYFYSNAKMNSFMNLFLNNPLDFIRNLKKVLRIIHSKTITQFGQMHLQIEIAGMTTEKRLRGHRERNMIKSFDISDEFHVYLEDGNKLSFRKTYLDECNTAISHGIISKSDHTVRSVVLKNENIALDKDSKALMEFFVDRFPQYEVRKDKTQCSFSYFQSNRKIVEISRVKVNHGLSNGIALFKTGHRTFQEQKTPQFEAVSSHSTSIYERSYSVLPFTHRACQDKTLSGGKGANLAKMKSFEKMFSIPEGVVITTTGYEEHLKQNPTIFSFIKELNRTGLTIEDAVAIGEKIQSAMRLSTLDQSLTDSLSDCGISTNSGRLAVRSSAVGEDGADLSSAGQLESILDVTFEQIGEKLLECWASNFRREVIVYRRTHGQLLNPSIAVVIQKMVKDGVAGVLFTCDPVRNDIGTMIINAVRGLGEQVVNGAVTPDEVVICKGRKTFKKPENCCLDDESINKLINVGIFLETTFGKPQDIEFIIKTGKVYIVQSRDITSRDRESHFELLTEFDDATLTDKEILTTANVGEVLCHPLTPLEQSVIYPIYDKVLTAISLEDITGWCSRHFPVVLHMTGQRIFLNIGETFLRQYEVISEDRLMELAIAGCQVFSEEMFEQAKLRYPKLSPSFAFMRMITMIKVMFLTSYKKLEEIKELKNKIESLSPSGQVSTKRLFELQEEQRNIKAQTGGYQHKSDTRKLPRNSP